MINFTKKQLIDKGYVPLNSKSFGCSNDSLMAKDITEDELQILIDRGGSIKSKDTRAMSKMRMEEISKRDIYRIYDGVYYHISNFVLDKPNTNKAFWSFSTQPKFIMTKIRNSLRDKINADNLMLIRKYYMGDETKELTFSVGSYSTNMEKKRVYALKDEVYISNYDLHHIVTISNQSRDKNDSDPSGWTNSTNLTTFIKDKVTSVIIDETNGCIVNGIQMEAVKHSIEWNADDNSYYLYTKTDNQIKRILELLTITILPKEEHTTFHNFIARKEHAIGINDYPEDTIPCSLRSKKKYDEFIDYACNEFKFSRSIFKTYEEHVQFLTI